MSLKKKFVIMLIVCLGANLLFLTLFITCWVEKTYSSGAARMQTILDTAIVESDLPITPEELHNFLEHTFSKEDILHAAYQGGITAGIRFSLFLFIILLVGISVILHLEISKPIKALNNKIKAFHQKNGYYISEPPTNELCYLSENLTQMCEQIEVNNKRKSELLSYISHDIKTPLTSIIGYSERLISPGIPSEEKQLKYYQTILSKAQVIKTLVEELDIYITDDIQPITFTPVVLDEFLETIKSHYEEELINYHIQLNLESQLGSKVTIPLDLKKMERVFANVISNSVSHGGNLHYINILSFVSEEHWVVRIENDGESLSETQYGQVFDLMYQVDSSRTVNSHNGKGLGLTIVKQIIVQHNGMVRAYKPLLGGFGIEFAIPLNT